ncbi:hypothetical protein XENOCAPTIV_007098, partial [Xenoophorus captivus]
MRKLDHCNIVRLRYFFYSSGEKKDEVYLNLVLDFVPETVYRVARHFNKAKAIVPIIYVKVAPCQWESTQTCARSIKALLKHPFSPERQARGTIGKKGRDFFRVSSEGALLFLAVQILKIIQPVYMYQLFRSLAYIHSQGVCHRDIKPQNLLVDPETAILKL